MTRKIGKHIIFILGQVALVHYVIQHDITVTVWVYVLSHNAEEFNGPSTHPHINRNVKTTLSSF